MKRTLFLLALVVGIVMAEEEEAEDNDIATGKANLPLFGILKAASVIGLVGPVTALINIGIQIVILIALVSFISSLKASTGDIFGDIFGKFKGEDDYAPYPAPAYEYYDHASGGGSSYASTGYSKRSVNEASPSVMDNPVVQRLTARIHEAIDNFNY